MNEQIILTSSEPSDEEAEHAKVNETADVNDLQVKVTDRFSSGKLAHVKKVDLLRVCLQKTRQKSCRRTLTWKCQLYEVVSPDQHVYCKHSCL